VDAAGSGRAYYNEWDPYAAQWLRNLIAAGHLPPGDVDERDIREVDPVEIKNYTQWHFFAGIGGWPYALRLAGWRDEWPVLTGSPPCQPFSPAGRRLGPTDERDLAPDWLRIIRELRPPVVFGEQVANAVGFGWLDGVLDELEVAGYAAGAVVLPACAVGAPHRRERIFIVADAHGDGLEKPQGVQGRRAGGGWGGYWRAPRIVRTEHGTYPVEPGLEPLAHGVPARVGRLRAYGNAIVPQVAAEIVRAWMDVRGIA